MNHTETPHSQQRRRTNAVRIGNVVIGNGRPVAVQSMTNTSTLDTDASAAQVCSIARAGGQIVRLTAQGVAHAANLANIHAAMREAGCQVPLVADIHFNPDAAFEAAKHVEKVRINPGNFIDPGRVFKQIDYTDAEYAAELQRLADRLRPLVELCRERGTALRIGVNHGSLSDRIMSRYGDTPAGMVESAMEFLRLCRDWQFDNVVVSLKASNVTVMVDTMRRMAAAIDAEGMSYPLHLGVTEAGDGEDGRVKSAVGIGTLLAEGLGDTIRVSLSEAPENEIPVAHAIINHVNAITAHVDRLPQRHGAAPKVVGHDVQPAELDGYTVIEAAGPDALPTVIEALKTAQGKVAVRISYPADADFDDVAVRASIDFGPWLLAGYADAVWLDAPGLTPEQNTRLMLGILQATRRRITRTEYIACPGCGRTLFDLPNVLARVRKATAHLSHLKIGVMGCIVNGPGEMADADYGYVGAAAGKVSLYRNRECVVRNIDAEDAVERLVELIKANGDWVEPDSAAQ